MALTPEHLDPAYRKVWSTVPHAQRLSAFALEIETEVRKQDTELIRQMRDALSDFDYEKRIRAIAAANARLEVKP